tara:strand:- start:241 stop:672 length:432 start_codon:yes stop_codon:yes gene_type:complete
MLKKIITLTLFTFIASATGSDQNSGLFTVQVAAYKHLPKDFVESVERYGTVNVSENGQVTRVSVGQFDNKLSAEELLTQLRQAGYTDAFISHRRPITSDNQHQRDPSGAMAKFRKLPDTDKDRAVFIDGKLHLKDGKQFILVP